MNDAYAAALAKQSASAARKAKRDEKRAHLVGKFSPRKKKIPKAKLHKRLRNKLDKEFSLLIRSRWPTCFFPGCGRPTADCFHFFTRSKLSIRWDERNAVGSCKGHNILYEQDQAFIDDVRLWFVERWGQDAWDTLKADGNGLAIFENSELEDMLEKIKTLRGQYETSARI